MSRSILDCVVRGSTIIRSPRSELALPSHYRFRERHPEVTMGRVLIGMLIGAFLGGGLGALIAMSNDRDGDIFISSDVPVTEDQVRVKLLSEGWAAIQVTRDERYIEATASKDGRTARLMIDSLTGQLITDDRDED